MYMFAAVMIIRSPFIHSFIFFHYFNQYNRKSEWNVVHRSETIKDNLDPKWEEENIDLSVLCRGELDEVLKFSVLDHERSGNHILMGQIEMSVNEFIEKMNKGLSFDLMKKGKDTSRGRIKIHIAEIVA